MIWLRTFLARFTALFRGQQLDGELEEELVFHMEMETERNLRNGMNPTEARRAARLRLGNPESIKENCRDTRNLAWMAALLLDLRFAVRMLRRNPGFTAVVVLTLALGVGTVATIFSAMNAAFFRPLPFREPDRLVVLREFKLDQPTQRRNPALSTLRHWREKAQSFERIETAVWSVDPTTFSGDGPAVRVYAGNVSPELFSLLGVEPQLGRPFLPEDIPGDVVIISQGLWQRYFGGDPEICGKTLRVNRKEKPVTVVGVMPPDFWFFPWEKDYTELWISHSLVHNEWVGGFRRLGAFARLKPGVHLRQAEAEMKILAQQLEAEKGGDGKDWGVEVIPLAEVFFGEWQRTFLLLLCAVSFVLLISCVNVANLLLARGRRRRTELAVRVSLGSGRVGMIRQLLAESLVLALIGGTLGLFATTFGIKVLKATAGSRFPRIDEITIDPIVLIFILAVSLLTGLLFGMAPALQAFRVDLVEHLKEGGGRFGQKSRYGLVSWLVICEVALTFVLLSGAGLMVSSFLSLQRVDLGFNPRNVLTMQTLLDGSQYVEQLGGGTRRVTRRVDTFYNQLLERVESLPLVESVGMTSLNPPYQFRILGRVIPPQNQRPQASYFEASPSYFKTLEIPLLKGRLLDERDSDGSAWVAVVNDAMVRRYFPNEDPLGQQLVLSYGAGLEEDQTRQIVGVVKDVRHWGLAMDPPPVIYLSQDQHLAEYPARASFIRISRRLVIRTRTDPLDLAPVVQEIISDIDKDQAVVNIRTMEQHVDASHTPRRFYLRLFGIFGAMAVALVMVGIYGVMSFSVSERVHEIGVRMALGAQRTDVLKMVLRRGLILILIGLAIGIVGSIWFMSFMESSMFGVSAPEPWTFVIVGLLVLAAGTIASWIPARWATKVDPVVALRYE